MSYPIQGATRTSTPSIASAATALDANNARYAFIIQNLGQNPLFVRFGGTASTTVFNVVLKGGTSNDDGTGGSFTMAGDAVWCGSITVAGTAPRYVATEQEAS